MDWLGILLAGLSGAIAAGIAILIVGNPKKRPTAYFVVIIISFIALNSLSRSYILPDLTNWNNARKV